MESLLGRSQNDISIKSRNKRRMKFVLICIVCAFVATAVFYLCFHWIINRTFHSYKVMNTITVKDSNAMSYADYDDGMLKYNRDGIQALDREGKTIWSGSYDMVNPKVDTSGEYVVVADVGEKDICIYDGKSAGKEITTDNPIVQASVSSEGVVSILQEETSSNSIGIYKPYETGNKLLVEVPTNVEDGYPVSMDLSDDGTSMVVSYLCITSGAAQSRVAFYNFTNVGKNVNCLVGAKNFNSYVISEVKYLDDTHVALFHEKGFAVWSNFKQPKVTYQQTYNKEIKSILYNNSRIVVVFQNASDTYKYQMKTYDLDGNEKLDTYINGEYSDAFLTGDQLVLHGSSNLIVYRLNGVKVFEQNIKNKIDHLFYAESENRFFLIQGSKIKVIKLK